MSIIKINRFGEKLHNLRIGQELTLKQLAETLGHSSHSYLCELEAGKKMPSIELVLQIASLFNVTTDALLRDDWEI